MHKIWLIVKREYLIRVMKKSFLLVTILAPLSIALIAFIGGYMASSNANTKKNIAVIDKTGFISNDNLRSQTMNFTIIGDDLETIKKEYTEKGYDMLVQIPALSGLDQTKISPIYYSKEKLSLVNIKDVEGSIKSALEAYKISQNSITQEQLDKLKIAVQLENAMISETDGAMVGDKSSKYSSAIATGLSYIMGFLMYMVIFIFGSMVMRSVMEEKINRIVEVMVSSVKPFQLMLGKVMGVGLVGLTQLLIWIILIPVILFAVSAFFGADMVGTNMPQGSEDVLNEMSAQGNDINKFMAELKMMNWWGIIPAFIIFFFGGYFLYSSLFAAVGSAIGDDIGEGQQLMLPIIVPVIIAFIMIPSVFNNPNGSLAVFGSLFPLFSPIIMPARLPFDPPVWQVILSIVFLIAGVIFFTWLAGRIYRVGIFMYGKKLTFKELRRWIFYKG